MFDVKVKGGGHYRHPLWNYESDTTCGVSWFGWIPIRLNMYKVEKFSLPGGLKAMVCLIPYKSWGLSTAWLAYWTFRPHQLKRVVVHEPGQTTDWSHLTVTNEQGVFHSLARAGDNTSFTFSAQEYELARMSHRNSSAKTSTTQMASWMEKKEKPDPESILEERSKGLVLLANLSDTSGFAKPANVTDVEAPKPTALQPPEQGVITYSANLTRAGDDANDRSTAMSLFKPIIAGGNFVPTNHSFTGIWAAKERVTELQKAQQAKYLDADGKTKGKEEKKDGKSKPQFKKKKEEPLVSRACSITSFKWMSEYADALAASIGPVSPVGPEDVHERRNKPRQRRIMEAASSFGKMVYSGFSAFVKGETYPEIKDPRVISTIPGPENEHWSRFSQPLGDAFKNWAPYGFRDPGALADMMVRICSSPVQAVDVGDFRRMDGNTYVASRLLDMAILRAVFKEAAPEAIAAYSTTFAYRTQTQS